MFSLWIHNQYRILRKPDQHNKQLEKTGEFIRDMRIFDEDRGLYWYPSVLNMGNLGIIYPEQTLSLNFRWRVGVSFVWKY